MVTLRVLYVRSISERPGDGFGEILKKLLKGGRYQLYLLTGDAFVSSKSVPKRVLECDVALISWSNQGPRIAKILKEVSPTTRRYAFSVFPPRAVMGGSWGDAENIERAFSKLGNLRGPPFVSALEKLRKQIGKRPVARGA